MKIVVDDCGTDDPFLLLYNPLKAHYALVYADGKGWNPERRWASPYIPVGEIWYTQELGVNRMFDCYMDIMEDALEDLLS